MLELIIPKKEVFDNDKQEFIIKEKEQKIQLEHSLVSLAKWESKWKKPFMVKDPKQVEERTKEELLDYIKCMTITQNVNDEVYNRITNQQIIMIQNYMKDKMTATWFKEDPNKRHSNEIITAEIIYYWMIQHNIPMECQKWHLNRLLTLIRVCSEKENKKPMKSSEILRNQAALNRARRKRH